MSLVHSVVMVFVDGHHALLAVEVQIDYRAVAQSQVSRLGVCRQSCRLLAAVTGFMEDAVLAGHQRFVVAAVVG